MAVAGHLEQPTRGSPSGCRCGPHLAAYLALLRLGVTVPPLLPAARWALTPPFHPYPSTCVGAVCFLWPCPSPFGAQALPGSLPCGARTFLGDLAAPATIALGQRGKVGGRAMAVAEGGKAGKAVKVKIRVRVHPLVAHIRRLAILASAAYPACPTLARPSSASARRAATTGPPISTGSGPRDTGSRASARRPSRS